MFKISRMISLFLLIAVSIIHSRDLKIVLPDSWEGFTKDTSKITIAVPHIGCFELMPTGKLPISNWKGLFVKDGNGGKLDSLNFDRNTVLIDVKLQVFHYFSFSDLSTYGINYEGNNINIKNDTFPERPVLFIANLPNYQNLITLYDGRKKEDKKIYKHLNLVDYVISIDQKDSCTEICKITANEKEQILFQDNSCMNKTKLIWVGDMNGDKKIDIILKRSGKEGLYSRMDLWLSTNDDKKLLNLESSMYYGGCN